MLAAVQKDVIEHWTPIRHLVSVPKTDAQCETMIDLLNDLLDEIGEDVEHPFYPLIETLGTLVENYEQRTIPEPEVPPASVLNFLMEENHLKPKDVRELGSDDMIDHLLHGTQEFNLGQIKFLCRRFHLKPDIFMSLQ